MKYEYRIAIRMANWEWSIWETHLNDWGRIGWELVAVSEEVAYFKRTLKK